jgi:hypothetical protein
MSAAYSSWCSPTPVSSWRADNVLELGHFAMVAQDARVFYRTNMDPLQLRVGPSVTK